MEPIRVLVVDDHPLVRRGLHSVLSPHEDIEVVGEASNAASALEQAPLLAPDVVLLDIRMAGASGIAIIRQLKLEVPGVKVAILTTFDEDEYLFEAVKEGADGYLLKTLSGEKLVEAIRDIYAGERLLTVSLAGKLMQEFQTLARKKDQSECGLSVQEIEILKEIAQGATNKEIAEKLFWSPITVKRKVASIFRKLGTVNRAQAVAEAMRRGLI